MRRVGKVEKVEKVESRKGTSVSASQLQYSPWSTFSSLVEGQLAVFAFEKLLVYQKAVDFADAICVQTEQFPRGYGFLVDQLNRAALSISSNIAESNGRFIKPDR
jgi:hypothetical protein